MHWKVFVTVESFDSQGKTYQDHRVCSVDGGRKTVAKTAKQFAWLAAQAVKEHVEFSNETRKKQNP